MSQSSQNRGADTGQRSILLYEFWLQDILDVTQAGAHKLAVVRINTDCEAYRSTVCFVDQIIAVSIIILLLNSSISSLCYIKSVWPLTTVVLIILKRQQTPVQLNYKAILLQCMQLILVIINLHSCTTGTVTDNVFQF